MKPKHRLEQRQEQELAESGASSLARETYDSVEDVLRRDREGMEVSQRVTERLSEAIGKELRPERVSWWRRWLGGGKP
jgi:hypothetical protein